MKYKKICLYSNTDVHFFFLDIMIHVYIEITTYNHAINI